MEDYKPRGWLGKCVYLLRIGLTIEILIVHLGIRKAGMNYIRFRDVKQPKNSEITNLIDRVRAELLNHMNSPPSVLVSASVPVTSAAPLHHEVFSDPSPTYEKSSDQGESQSKVALPPTDQWTLADIHLWFAHQYISPQLRDLYQFRSGTEVLDYAQDLVNDRMTQQQTY
jgi:hypothetical protein